MFKFLEHLSYYKKPRGLDYSELWSQFFGIVSMHKKICTILFETKIFIIIITIILIFIVKIVGGTQEHFDQICCAVSILRDSEPGLSGPEQSAVVDQLTLL